MQVRRRGAGRALLLAVVLVATGCAAATEALAGGANEEIRGEVRRVDERSRTIEVASRYGGSRAVRYDSRTRAVDGERSYPVRSLARGEPVRMRVSRDRGGALYVDRIYLERSRTAHGGPGNGPRHGGARVFSYEGRVSKIDHRHGRFELQPARGKKVKVLLPSRPSPGLNRSLQQLRNGSYVRIQAEPLQGNQVRAVRIY